MAELSKRLQAVADLVTPGMRLADVGTDHAYIPIYLTQNGLVPSAIAMDIHISLNMDWMGRSLPVFLMVW